MMQSRPKLRFAPSPNGYMHIGHAYSALLNVETARAMGAEFIIRMEDIDLLRCPMELQQACLDDLAAIGVKSEAEIIYQSQRQDAYLDALNELTEMGVLYPCLATRGEIKRYYETNTRRLDPDNGLIYPLLYKNLSLTERQKILTGVKPFTLRIDMSAALNIIKKMGKTLDFVQVDLKQHRMAVVEFDPMVWGDVVLARKDIGTSYHLSVVVDDEAQDISHVIRGMDLYFSTYIQRVLQILLGYNAPVYYHHELVMDEEMNKLAKSTKSQPIREIIGQNKGLYYFSDLLKLENMRNITDRIAEIVRKNDGK